jgi:hypothetical protein
MKILLYLSNIFFIIFWITRSSPLIKFLATFILSFYCFLKYSIYVGLKHFLFSIGDFIIEKYHINYAILIFGIAKSTIHFYILICSLLLFYYISENNWVILYFMIFSTELILNLNLSNILFLISDLIIVFDVYIFHFYYSSYISYFLYWLSLIIYEIF